jgi:hypothetical protein
MTSGGASAMIHKGRQHTIQGLLIPIDWNENNIVTEVAIKASDGATYIVGQNEKGNELLALIYIKVEATGVVGADEYSDVVISVDRYVVL